MYYSESKGGFIPTAWKTDGTYSEEAWPKDAVLATEEEISKYWKQRAPDGCMLGAAGGRPAWVSTPPQKKKTREQVEEDRRFAYAGVFNGSDRLYIEMQAEVMLGNTEAAESAKSAWLARREEIKEQNPWP